MRRRCDDAWPLIQIIWVPITGILIIGAFATGLLIGALPFTDQWKPGWEMVSGLGTVAAVFAAIWVAGIEKRRRYEEDDVRMRLTAARLYRQFEIASKRLGRIANDIDSFEKNYTSNLEYIALLDRLRSVNLAITDMNAELFALSQLPNQAGYLLSSAIGAINLAIDIGDNLEKDYPHEFKEPVRIRSLVEINFYTKEAEQQLKKVSIECQMASEALISQHQYPPEPH